MEIGDCVRVFWPEEQAYFFGTVKCRRSDQFKIVYDDGDEQWESITVVEKAERDVNEHSQVSFRSLHINDSNSRLEVAEPSKLARPTAYVVRCCILSAHNLRFVDKAATQVSVKAFMLGCESRNKIQRIVQRKKLLCNTPPLPLTADPHWMSQLDSEYTSHGALSCVFQVHIQCECNAIEDQCCHCMQSSILFVVYSQTPIFKDNDTNFRSEIIYQKLLSCEEFCLHEAVEKGSTEWTYLESDLAALQRTTSDDKQTTAATLCLAFHAAPVYLESPRSEQDKQQESRPTMSIRRSSLIPRKTKVKVKTAAHAATTHKKFVCSSKINRIRAERKIDLENRAIRKRRDETRPTISTQYHFPTTVQSSSKPRNCTRATLNRPATAKQLEKKEAVEHLAVADEMPKHIYVEHVLHLEAKIAEWKANLFRLQRKTDRLEMSNKKEAHIRDCLQIALRSHSSIEESGKLECTNDIKLEKQIKDLVISYHEKRNRLLAMTKKAQKMTAVLLRVDAYRDFKDKVKDRGLDCVMKIRQKTAQDKEFMDFYTAQDKYGRLSNRAA